MKKEEFEEQEARANRFAQPAQFIRILKRPDAKLKGAPVTAMKAVAKPPATFTWKFDRGGPCKRGETAKSSGCIPASKEPGQKREAKPKEAPAPKGRHPKMDVYIDAVKKLEGLEGKKDKKKEAKEAKKVVDGLLGEVKGEPEYVEKGFGTKWDGMPGTVLEGSTKASAADKEWWEHIKKDPKVQEALAQIKLPPTSDKFMFDTGKKYIDKNGDEQPVMAWDKDRIAEKWDKWKSALPETHQIRDDAKPKAGKKPRAVIFLGPSGAGKTSKLSKVVDQSGTVIINPDDVKAVMDDPDYNGMNAGVIHNESSSVSSTIEKDAIKGGYNITLDQTGRDPDKVRKQIEKLNKRGYDIEIHLADVDGSESARRAHYRFMHDVDKKTGEPTNRFVHPLFVIEAVDNNPQRTYDMFRDHPAIKRRSRWDTSQAHDEDAVEIEDDCPDSSYAHCSERSMFMEEKGDKEEKAPRSKEEIEREKARVAAGLAMWDHDGIAPENMYDVSDSLTSWVIDQIEAEERAEAKAKGKDPEITPMKKKEPLKKPREMK